MVIILLIALIFIGFIFPKKALFSLPFLSAINGWPVVILNINIRLDQALGIILLLSILFRKVALHQEFKYNNIISVLILFLAANIISSLFSENPFKSLFQVINIISVFSIYVSVFNLIDTKQDYLKFLNLILISGFCAMSYGLFLFFLKKIGFDVEGVNIAENVGDFGIYASLFEPNIFGSYSASMLLLGTGIYMLYSYDGKKLKKIVLLIFLLVSFLALVFSYARAAWIGAFAGMIYILLIINKKVIFKLRYIFGFISLILLIYFLFLFKILPEELYSYKITNLINFNEGTGFYRLNLFFTAWHDFLNNPIIGNGTFSFSYINPDEALIINGKLVGAWLPNLFLLTLNDTGIIGFFILVYLIKKILDELKNLIRYSYPLFYYHAIGYKGAFIALLIAYLATTAFYLGFTWILIAMISVGFNLFNEELYFEKIGYQPEN